MTPTDAAPLLARKLLDYVAEDLLGTGPRHAEVAQDSPRNMFPAGNLGPRSLEAERTEDFRQTEFTPSSVGLLFRFREGEETVSRVSGGFNVFVPVHPTLAELRLIAARWEESIPGTIDWANPSQEDRHAIDGAFVKYRPRYLRRRVAFSFTLKSGSLVTDNKYHVVEEATAEIHEAFASLLDDPSLNRAWIPVDRNDNLPALVLLSEAAFDEYFSRFDRRASPVWRAKVQYRAWREEGHVVLVELLLSNDLGEAEARQLPRLLDPHLFVPELHVTTPQNRFVPFELDLLRSRDYRVDAHSQGLGINCDILFRRGDDGDTLSTDVLPIHVQFRTKPAELPGYPLGAPTFTELASEPLSHLEKISEALDAYRQWWSGSFDDFVKSGVLKLEQRREFDVALRAFEDEVRRFRRGVELLADANNASLLGAFRLMNEAFEFQSKAKPRVKAWYPFQLVFIVSNLPDLLARTGGPEAFEPNPVVLWYATGGGKTEAYLGLALVHAFWDRLRGKRFGVTAWCKFPLRLLSMQQLSRISHLVAYAERVRATTPDIPAELKGDPFSVGLFAGRSNSANYLDFPPEATKETKLSFEAERIVNGGLAPSNPWIRKNRKVDRCPMCALDGRTGEIETSFDPSVPRFHHVCGRCGHRLPLHVSDTETLRYLPTVVVGTIDKLAALGRVPATKVFFGYARRRCEEHGYLLPDGEACPILACGRPLERVDHVPDPTPSLLIQDELHFLRETLGAFDSHYETMTLAIMREAARELSPRLGPGWKIIGSTATIEGYGDQIRHLYDHRNSIRFPVAGPTRGRHFYANEDPDAIQRFIVGFRPQSMSHIDAVMKVLLSFHRFTLPLADGADAAWAALGEPFAAMSKEERQELAKRYRTSIAYALTRAECGQINKAFTRQLNPLLAKEGLPEFEDSRVRNLTGEMDSDDVQEALNQLENPPPNWIQAISATSMVSHGVDLEVLNFIAFRGQPHTISEWIQAMSRVGRAKGFPAVVVNVYNPNRERDASYYRHHKKYIEHADTLIRLVPITRFSPSALRKTAPGLFYNALSFFAAPPDLPYMFREQLKRRFPSIRDKIGDLMRTYLGLNPSELEPKERRLLQELDQQLEDIQAVLESPTSPDKTLKALGPMTSLREVDVPVQIVPDYDYAKFAPRRGPT